MDLKYQIFSYQKDHTTHEYPDRYFTKLLNILLSNTNNERSTLIRIEKEEEIADWMN